MKPKPRLNCQQDARKEEGTKENEHEREGEWDIKRKGEREGERGQAHTAGAGGMVLKARP